MGGAEPSGLVSAWQDLEVLEVVLIQGDHLFGSAGIGGLGRGLVLLAWLRTLLLVVAALLRGARNGGAPLLAALGVLGLSGATSDQGCKLSDHPFQGFGL